MTESRLRIALDSNRPWASTVTLDGRPVTNVKAIRVEQSDQTQRPVVELTVIGAEIAVEADLGDVLVRGLCPRCKADLATPDDPPTPSGATMRRAEIPEGD